MCRRFLKNYSLLRNKEWLIKLGRAKDSRPVQGPGVSVIQYKPIKAYSTHIFSTFNSSAYPSHILMKPIVAILSILIACTIGTAQPVTGVWRGTLTKGSGPFAKQGKMEVKLVKKGDSLVGASYIYFNAKTFIRHSLRGHFDSVTNAVHWADYRFIEKRPASKDVEGSSAPMVSQADFNCPGGDLMKLDGKSDIGDEEHFDLHLTKLVRKEKTLFPDEWDNVIEGYFAGMADPDIIDSVWAIASVPQEKNTATIPTTDIAKNEPKKETPKEVVVTQAAPPVEKPVVTPPVTIAKQEPPKETPAPIVVKTEPPVQKPEPVVAKLEPPVKKEEPKPVEIKKTDPVVVAKAEPPVQKPEPTIAKAEPPVKKEEPKPIELKKTDSVVIAKKEPPVTKSEPVVAKIEPPVKTAEPKAVLTKKVDSTVVAKTQPPVAKTTTPPQPVAKTTVPPPAAKPQTPVAKPVVSAPAATKTTTPPLASATPPASTPKVAPIVIQPVAIPQKIDPVAVQKYTTRKKIEQGEIPMVGDTMELNFYDNAEVDGDSISLFVNGKLMFNHVLLSTQAYTFKLPIKDLPDNSELAMVAENLGTIPPNTSYMMAVVNGERYSVRLESTESSSGIIKLVRR